jgi:hypothetical protein
VESFVHLSPKSKLRQMGSRRCRFTGFRGDQTNAEIQRKFVVSAPSETSSASAPKSGLALICPIEMTATIPTGPIHCLKKGSAQTVEIKLWISVQLYRPIE